MFSALHRLARIEDTVMLAIIGGTGLTRLEGFEQVGVETLATPYSDAGVELPRFQSAGREFIFLPRHGAEHQLAPHRINYRANIWALAEAGVRDIVAVNAVGAIHRDLRPGTFAVPDQIIDYSHSRESTFFDGELQPIDHIDFTTPYSETLRQRVLQSVERVNERRESPCAALAAGTYGCMQGPRLETAAEIRRLARDGCDMVGMTGMPEAALARELQLQYASLALSVNWAAGLSDDPITLADIHAVLESGMEFVAAVFAEVLRAD